MALSSAGRALVHPPSAAQRGAHLRLQEGVPLPSSCARQRGPPGALAQSLSRAPALSRCNAEGESGPREWARQYPVREGTGAHSGAGRRGSGRGRGAWEGRGTRGGRGAGDWARPGDRAGDRSGSFKREDEEESEDEDATSDGSSGNGYRSLSGRGRGLGRGGGGGGGRGGPGRDGRWSGRESGGEGRAAAFRDAPTQRARSSSGQAPGRGPQRFESAREQAREVGAPPGYVPQGRGDPESAGSESPSRRFQLDAEGNLKGPRTDPPLPGRRASTAGTRTRQQRSANPSESVSDPRGAFDRSQPRVNALDASGQVAGGEEAGAGGAGGGRAVVHEVDPNALVRVSKLLSERGLCSRREADGFIARGLVLLDGQPVTELGTRALRTQVLTLAPQAQRQQDSRLTVLLHKPVGYVSHADDDGAYATAATLITPVRRWQGPQVSQGRGEGEEGAQEFGEPSEPPPRGLAPAGRLDIDSTGLLVLTQDGRVARLLVGEEGAVEKEYLVRVEGRISARNLALLNEGLHLDGRPLRPALVEWQNQDQLRFVLREGRKRQIRRMCELVGLRVLALKRVRIGGVPLGNLPLGQWRVLGPHEAF